MSDERGFDGVTVREAIASRTLGGLDRLVGHLKSGRMSFEDAHVAIEVLLDVTMPFCDPGTQVLLRQLQSEFNRQAATRAEAEREIAVMTGEAQTDYGLWSSPIQP